jgi:hypothetical protein
VAEYFVMHDFLVRDGVSPESATRETAASILVNAGTTPNEVVKAALQWMKEEWRERGPFSVTWYTGNALVAATLQEYRVDNVQLRSAAELFLLPGPVNSDLDSVMGRVPAEFVLKQIDRHFSCLILGAHSFDMVSGTCYFHFPDEIELQQRCALLPARDKFLFLDPSKFRKEGEAAYEVHELLNNCQSVTIYSVIPEKDSSVLSDFETLTHRMQMVDAGSEWVTGNAKRLRLTVINDSGQLLENRVKMLTPNRGDDSLDATRSVRPFSKLSNQ